MAHRFTMPKFGQTMEEGTVKCWHKQEGEHVAKGEVLLEVESDKAVMEVESDVDGILLRIEANKDQVRKCDELLAWIGQPGECLPVNSRL